MATPDTFNRWDESQVSINGFTQETLARAAQLNLLSRTWEKFEYDNVVRKKLTPEEFREAVSNSLTVLPRV
jgi:hypothetical protein